MSKDSEVIVIDDDEEERKGESPCSVIELDDDGKILNEISSAKKRGVKREAPSPNSGDEVIFVKETPGAKKLREESSRNEVVEVSVAELSSAAKAKLIQRLLAEKKELEKKQREQKAVMLSVATMPRAAVPGEAKPSYWRRDGAGNRLRENDMSGFHYEREDTQTPNRDARKFIRLEPGYSEYDSVAHRFLNTGLAGVEIISIHRHMNMELWEPYSICRRRITQSLTNSSTAISTNYCQDMLPGLEAEARGVSREVCCERYLFHGASPSTIETILESGIDFRLSKIEGAMGACAYFADTASYSHSYCIMPEHAAGQVIHNGRGYHQPHRPASTLKMLVCRTLLGDCTHGRSGLRRPPPKANNSTALYNSVSNRPSEAPNFFSQGFMFGVFANDQVYPEYVIEYKQNNASHHLHTQAQQFPGAAAAAAGAAAAAAAAGNGSAAAYIARLHQLTMAINRPAPTARRAPRRRRK